MSYTKPNIPFAINLVSEHMHSPKEIRPNIVYRILKYLKGFSKKGLFFKTSKGGEIKFFTDADWVRLTEDRRSITRYCIFAWENLVTWRNNK